LSSLSWGREGESRGGRGYANGGGGPSRGQPKEGASTQGSNWF